MFTLPFPLLYSNAVHSHLVIVSPPIVTACCLEADVQFVRGQEQVQPWRGSQLGGREKISMNKVDTYNAHAALILPIHTHYTTTQQRALRYTTDHSKHPTNQPIYHTYMETQHAKQFS